MNSDRNLATSDQIEVHNEGADTVGKINDDNTTSHVKATSSGSSGPSSIIDVNANTSKTAQEVSNHLFKFLQHKDAVQVKRLLQKEGDFVSIMDLRDAKHFSVLSFAAYINSEECFMALYHHMVEVELKNKPEKERQALITSLANQQTDEGFNCLHFAVYHGNFDLIKFLVETLHVNIYQKNKFGSTVLHIAA